MRGAEISLSVAIVFLAVIIIIAVLILGSSRFLKFLSYGLLNANHVFLGNAISLSFTIAAISTGDFVYSSIWQPFYLETTHVSLDSVTAGSKYFGSGDFKINLIEVNKTIDLYAPFGSFQIKIPRLDAFGNAILNRSGDPWLVKGKSLRRAEYGSVSSQVILDYLYRAYQTASSKKIDIGGAYVNIKCLDNKIMINGEIYTLKGFNCSGSISGYVNTLFIKYSAVGDKVTLVISERIGG